MKITFFSDTHTFHHSVKIGECDVLCCTGDITSSGEASTFLDFMEWFSQQPAKHKIYIAGNHDTSHERAPKSIKIVNDAYRQNTGIIYLENSEVVIDGVKFYGSPYQPEFYNWAFNLRRGNPLKANWALIPDDVDILLTHGPAYGVLDETDLGEHVGCEDLRERIKELKQLKVHAMGHIHHSYGQTEIDGVKYINSCICTEQYRPDNQPITVEI